MIDICIIMINKHQKNRTMAQIDKSKPVLVTGANGFVGSHIIY